MSGQATGRTLLLEARELATLLAGCGIEGLYMPALVSQAVVAESDVTDSMMGLVRDGLMTQAADGLLDYAPDLHEVLLVLRDCSLSVLLWADWLGDEPRYLHLSPGQDAAVEVVDDPLRPGSVRVRLVDLDLWCGALVDASSQAKVEFVEVPEALKRGLEVGPVEGRGSLFAAWCFRRGADRPRQLLRGVRLYSGNALVVHPRGGNNVIPLDARSLAGLLKEADGK
jgi:hypothetical protein